MKRNFILATIVACACALALAGCSSAPSSSAASESDASGQDSVAGFWVLEGSDQLGFMGALNLDTEENFAELMISNDYLDGTWVADGNTAIISFGDFGDIPEDEEAVEGESGEQSGESAEAKSEGSSDGTAEGESEGSSEEDKVTKVKATLVDGKLVLGSDESSKLVFARGDMDEFFNKYYAIDEEEWTDEDFDVEVDEDGNEVLLPPQEGDDADFEAVEELIEDIKPITLVDNDQVTITANGKGTDFMGACGFRFSVKNNGKKAIYAEVVDGDVRLGNKRTDGVMGVDAVAPGETVETFFSIEDENVTSVDDLKDIQGKIRIGDDNTGEEIAMYDFKIE